MQPHGDCTIQVIEYDCEALQGTHTPDLCESEQCSSIQLYKTTKNHALDDLKVDVVLFFNALHIFSAYFGGVLMALHPYFEPFSPLGHF